MEQLLGFALYLLSVTSIFAMLAMSLDLQAGSCGLMNFGQIAFLLIGAYTTAIGVNAGLDTYFCMVLSMATAALFGVLMSLTVRNMSGTYWGILSLSAAELIRLVFLNERWLADGANGLSVLVTIPHFHLTVLVCTALVFWLLHVVWRSPFGRVIRMIREGDRLPQALGRTSCCSSWRLWRSAAPLEASPVRSMPSSTAISAPTMDCRSRPSSFGP